MIRYFKLLFSIFIEPIINCRISAIDSFACRDTNFLLTGNICVKETDF